MSTPSVFITCPTDAPARATIEPDDVSIEVSWSDLATICGYGAIVDTPNALTRSACRAYFDAWAAERAELLDAMTRGFTTTLLWTDAVPIDMDDNGETGGLQDRTPTPELRARAMVLCMRFYARAGARDIDAHMDAFGDPDGGHPGEYVGHTFYLDAAGHGVSFLDRMPSPSIIGVGATVMRSALPRLHDAAKTLPEVEHLYAYELVDGTVGV